MSLKRLVLTLWILLYLTPGLHFYHTYEKYGATYEQWDPVPKYCSSQDIAGFCIFPRDYKKVFGNSPSKVSKLIELLPMGDYNYNHTDGEQWNSYQDMCDLEYIHDNKQDANKGSVPKPSKKNPYKIEVTEIEENGHVYKNWLHFKITGGPMKIILLIVLDERGWPVGSFDNDMPCSKSCSCSSSSCYVATAEDSIPCMYTPPYAISHPDQLWIYKEAGVNEVHATWKFAQSSSIEVFTRELHFKSLLIDDTSSQTFNRIVPNKDYLGNDPQKKGIFGYTATYPIYVPKAASLGAWDHHYLKEGSFKLNCHKKTRDDLYAIFPYPSYNGFYNLGESGGLNPKYPSAMVGTQDCHYRYWNNEHTNPREKSSAKSPKAYLGVVDYDKFADYKCMWPGQVKDRYTPRRGRIVQPDMSSAETQLTEALEKLVDWSSNRKFQTKERCTCIDNTSENFVHPLQIQGRKQHCTQMIIAWLFLLPSAIFVARYYKETYHRVFWLQEYWWFTFHVILLIGAAIVMLGGSYAMALKRQNKYSESFQDWAVLVHFILGVIGIIFFWIHLLVGVWRPSNVQLRIAVIFFHWFFGIFEFLLAFAAIIVTAWIRNGIMSCWAFYGLGLYLIINLLFFAIMEIHMRRVDRQLELDPKRSYLPPPVMRVFDKDAPGSKFRIWMLIIYMVVLFMMVGVLYGLLEYNYLMTEGMSCWDPGTEGDLEGESTQIKDEEELEANQDLGEEEFPQERD